MLSFEKISSAVANLLEKTPNPSDTEVRALALELAIQEYEAAIRSRLARHDVSRFQAQLHADLSYFIFVAPQEPTRVISESSTVVEKELPPVKQYRVKQKHLAAFCKEFKLNEAAMHAVGMGTRKEWKGWTRYNTPGQGYLLGEVYKDPMSADPRETAQKMTVLRKPWSLLPVDWTPRD